MNLSVKSSLEDTTPFLKILALSVACTAIIVLFHLLNGTTLMNKSDAFLAPGLKTQLTIAPYIYRPIYPNVMNFLTSKLTQNVQFAYISIQSLGLLFFITAMQCAGNFLGGARVAVISGIVTAVSYPIMFAFFEPVYSHDDLFHFGFCALGLLALLQNKLAKMAVLFSAATLFREATLFLFPSIVLSVFLLEMNNKSPLKESIAKTSRVLFFLFIPTLLHISLLILYKFSVYPGRYQHWRFNFASVRLYDTLFSFSMAYLPAIFFTITGLRCRLDNLKENSVNLLRYVGFLSLPIFIAVVLIATKARETRIFFPPAIALILVASVQLNKFLKRIGAKETAIIFIFWLAVALLLMNLPPKFEFRPTGHWHWAYAIFMLGTCTNLLICNAIHGRNEKPECSTI